MTATALMEPGQTTQPDTAAEAEARDDAREAEGRKQFELRIYSQECPCPRCKSPIPKEAIKTFAKTNETPPFRLYYVVLVYCPACAAAYEADFTREGRRASPARLVMDSRAKELLMRLPNVFPAAGDDGDPGPGALEPAGLVERVEAAMEEEAEMDKAELAKAIERTAARLLSLQAQYTRRFEPRMLSAEEKDGIDRMGVESGQAEARLEEHQQGAAPSLGGVPAPAAEPPERTIDRSTSQEEPERWDGLS